MEAQILLEEGIDLKNNKRYQESEEAFIKALAVDPENERIYYHMALLEVDKGNSHRAVGYYKKALELRPNYYKALNNLGLIYKERKEYNNAIDCFEQAIAIAPDEGPAYFNLAMVYYIQRDYATTLDLLLIIVDEDLHPRKDDELYSYLGDCYLFTGDIPSAKNAYQHLIENYNSDHLIATNQLGFIALEVEHDLKTAEHWINKALSINPEFKPAVQNKGLLLKALHNAQEALTFLEKVIALDPSNFEGYYNIACVYSDIEDEENVKNYLSKAVQMAPFIKDHVRQDPDFGKYRIKDWFSQLVK